MLLKADNCSQKNTQIRELVPVNVKPPISRSIFYLCCCYCVLFLAYFCDNWNIVPYATHTHTAGNTWCRAPGMLKP